MTPDEFKKILRERAACDIVPEYITSGDPGPVVTKEALEFVVEQTRIVFQIPSDASVKPIVVGSAKLGFSFTEKIKPEYKPRYRAYQPGVSDIDLALVSPLLYVKVWKDIAVYGSNQTKFPWRSQDLGDYMLHGWLRPDKFPTPSPPGCANWFDLLSRLNRSDHFRHKRLRCGLYYSAHFLELYQQRGIIEAKNAELSDL
ncbi:hypothetical protein [Burkholderia sp. BCC1638]|uniref:hypothetical protein n=1 Tax=Burkholderia sp. BCC1638 TaxID=2681391 RepID=UPI00158BBB8E|nr:hypothetical protein [Burkholderia sp. BCC1638]